jgi:hypothetical protein
MILRETFSLPLTDVVWLATADKDIRAIDHAA